VDRRYLRRRYRKKPLLLKRMEIILKRKQSQPQRRWNRILF
jgi:hypothetical protein